MNQTAPSGELRRRKNAQKASANIPSYDDDNGWSSEAEGKRPRRPSDYNSISKKINEYDEYAWFVVLLTALAYFITTRGGNSNRGGVLSSFSKAYNVLPARIVTGDREGSEKLLRSIFYIANSRPTQGEQSTSLTLEHNRRLEVLLSSPPDVEIAHNDQECISSNDSNQKQQSPIPYLSHISSTTWVHDEELGRGFLLLADAGRAGRIWRWEVGGGPITIGRSLHMERSGCRSGLWVDIDTDGKEDGSNGTCPENLFGKSACSKSSSQSKPSSSISSNNPPLLGSASLAVELTRNAERSSAGSNIIVAEWGERRIVRVEGESGARTPLVTLVPTRNDDGKQEWRRVFRPNHLLYSPFGDLLFSDNFERDVTPATASNSSHVGVVYRRKEAVHIPSIAVEQSRDAHGWTTTTNEEHDDDGSIDILFETKGSIEGMALGADYSALFILVTNSNNSGLTKTVYKFQLSAEDDDDDEDSGDDGSGKAKDEVTVFYQMASTDCKDDDGEANDNYHSSIGSKLAVDEKGTLYLIACPSSVSLLSPEDGHVVGTLALDHTQKSQETVFFTSVGFGEDGYLYITSPNELMRVKSRVGGMSLPTNMVVPPPLKKKGEGQGDK